MRSPRQGEIGLTGRLVMRTMVIETDIRADVILDATGLMCPLPAVKTALALEKMAPQEVLEVITTDELSLTDLPRWCEETGNQLVGIAKKPTAAHIYIRKLQ